MSENVVKSAARVLEVFEFFATRRLPASVSEVCSGLGYPQSSTSVLLKSLHTLGYLAYDMAARRYVPTPRVTLLGSWLQENADGLPTLLEALQRATGETVLLAQQAGMNVEYAEVLRGAAESSSTPTPGVERSLVGTASGRILLARMSDAQALRILRRTNADEDRTGERVDERELLDALREARLTGFAMTSGKTNQELGGIATLAPQVPGQPPLAIAVAATTERIVKYRDQIIAKLKQHVPQRGLLR